MAATLERVTGSTTTASPSAVRRGGQLAFALAAAVLAAAPLAVAPVVGSDQVARAILLLLWALAGAGLALRRPGEPMASVVLLATTIAGLESLGAAVAADAGVRAGARDAAVLIRHIALGLLPAAALHIVVALPDGHLARATHRGTAMASYVLGAGLGLALWAARPAAVWPVGVFGALAFVLAATISNGRYRRARGIDRQRMQWFGWATSVAVIVAVVAATLWLLVSWPTDVAIVTVVATFALPLSLLIGASARMVAHVDRLLGHTVALAGLVGLVAVVYVVVVLGFGLGREPTDDERTLLGLSMAAAAVTALLFPTTRARLAEFSTRLVYGEQHAPDEVLRTFGSRMSRAVPMDELLLQAAESLRKTFGLDAIEIWTGQAGSLERTVSLPERGKARMTIGAKEMPVMARAGVTGRAWLRVWLPQVLKGRDDSMVRLAPVAHQGEVLGAIVVERYRSADVFGEEEERVLTDLARTIGVALHNVQLDSALQETLNEVRRHAEDLRASRVRIVKAADAARRKLERDLHDGAQQHVVALAVKTKLIKTLLDADADTAKQMLDDLGGDIQEAVQQLRDLAHGIFPPLLADRGLSAALESVASKAVLPTTVDTDSIERYPLEIESAVYFCALEAMTNAGKHAGEGATASIKVRAEEGVLLFEVADTGAGFDAAGKGLGAGFVNMRDRVGAAGGTLDVRSAPGQGTTITGRIPI